VAQQREDLVLVHAEAEVVDRHLLAEGLTELVHHDGGSAQQALVHLLCGDGGCSILQSDGVKLSFSRGCLLREPVGGEEGEVPGLGHSHLRPPHLREVPGQRGVDEDVSEQDAADRADVNAVVGLQEGTGANLQANGRDQAADDLGGLVRNRGGVHGEDHDVDHEEACKQCT
jgi:hypothetical protein